MLTINIKKRPLMTENTQLKVVDVLYKGPYIVCHLLIQLLIFKERNSKYGSSIIFNSKDP